MVIWLGLGPAISASGSVFSADRWGPPTGGPHRLAWYGADRPCPPRAGSRDDRCHEVACGEGKTALEVKGWDWANSTR